MAPPAKAKGKDALKQKSLMSFFGKDTPTKTAKPGTKSISSLKPAPPKTPKMPTSSVLPSSGAKSTASSNQETPPPSSDFIDIDMLSDDPERSPAPRVTKSRVSKRKMVLDDSDEDIVAKHESSSPPLESRAKKPRISAPPSSEDDAFDEETEENQKTFSRRLTHFKKSPSKSTKKSSAKSSDNDDFFAASDSDEVQSISSRVRSSASSRASNYDEDDEDEEQVSKKKPTKVAKKKTTTTGTAATPFTDASFLTAAERREQDKKEDKKAAENPYAFLRDLQDKDRKRPGDPQYDPRTLYIPANVWKTFTPFEKQFWEIKQNHYDTILFFQKGKFLELYEEDARIGHREFDLKLTQRVKMSMVGVPEMSFNFWASKFLGKGYKVGRVDQAETALGAEMRIAADKSKGKGKAGDDKIVRRELNKVYTNGTLVDAELLGEDQGHCISIQQYNSETVNRFGICILDCSTSQFNLSGFEDDVCLTKLDTLLRQVKPKEILHTKGALSVSVLRLLKSILSPSCLWTVLRDGAEGLGYEETLQEIKQLYPSENDEMDEDDAALTSSTPQAIRAMADDHASIVALGSMIWYLKTLNIAQDILTMKNFDIYDPMQQGKGLTLDGQSLAHLEILLNNEGTEEGSLLELLQRCVTPFGKRLFRIWLTLPLRHVAAINDRLDAVQELMDDATFEAAFMKIAKGLPDLERVVSRIHAKNCKVKDFLRVMSAFEKLSEGMAELAKLAESFSSKSVFGLLRSVPDLLPHIANVEQMYCKPSGDKESEDILIPEEGQDTVYEEIETEIAELEDQLEKERKKLEKSVKIPLTYWHSAQGNKEIYLVQTKPGEKMPKDWKKEASTKAVTRYSVPLLQPIIRSLKEAKENRKSAVKNFTKRVFSEFDTDRAVWLRAVRIFAELDCLFSLAKSSLTIEPRCRPEFVENDSAFIDFEELRHPTLSNKTEAFIPNDIKLGGTSPNIALLTGPNMAGKSTSMRMTATAVIMAQLGMYVPARKAKLSPCDSIITRMGAYDNMFSNASTFKVELDECCKILRNATPKSLVILDELGRGTSTYDGMAIAGSVLHQLATHTLSLTFFATHYGTLTDDYSYHPNIRNMHMSTLVDEAKRDLIFLYKLVDGVATGSFGTHVANLAGVPLDVVERAAVISKEFSQQFSENLKDKRKNSASSKLPLVAQADFAYLFGVATGKIQLPASATRQRQVLAQLKETIRSGYGQTVRATA